MRFAYNIKKEIVSVINVDNGKKCNCTCYCCGIPVIANQGKKNEWHFKHESKADCSYSKNPKETDLHLLAKSVFDETKTLMLPVVKFNGEIICNSSKVTFDNVEIEKPVEGFTPDAIGVKNENILWIEFAVTHFTEERKREYAFKKDISIIEIDLSKIDRNISKLDLKNFLINSTHNRYFVYSHPLYEVVLKV